MKIRIETVVVRLVDAGNRLVAADLEAKLEYALRDLAAAETSGGRTRPPLPRHDTDLQDLATLAADLPSLFHAATTTHRERKEIVRTLVQRVRVIERSAEHVVVIVIWNDGAKSTELRIPWDGYNMTRYPTTARCIGSSAIGASCSRVAADLLG